MITTDLFKNNRAPKKLNETIEKTFGRKINFEAFNIEQLEDARNKLRTQIYTARTQSGFNETIENDALTQAQWMHDAIVAELMDRNEPIVDNTQVEEDNESQSMTFSGNYYFMRKHAKNVFLNNDLKIVNISQDDDSNTIEYTVTGSPENLSFAQSEFESMDDAEGSYGGAYSESATMEGHGSLEVKVQELLQRFDNNANEVRAYGDPDAKKIIELLKQGDAEGAAEVVWYAYSDQDGGEVPEIEPYVDDLQAEFEELVNGSEEEYGDWGEPQQNAGFGQQESAPPTAKGERMVKHIKKGYAADGKLTDKEKSIAYATAWKQHNKDKNESIETGEDMTRLQEGEIQQASAIVTAKTMVDRVGRWIEELSGMENDTLLQLGDSIRDEMGQEAAKQFISACAPAIQQALQNLKDTRETLASGVRTLTGEEQPAEMLGGDAAAMGGEPAIGGDEFGGEAAPDEMNAEPELDAFAAAEPAVGGDEAAGRAQRESIDRSNNLLRVLAG